MTGQNWYRKIVLIIASVIIALCVVALVVGWYEAKPPEPINQPDDTTKKVITKVEFVEVVKEVDPYDWQEFIVTGYSANDPTQGTNNITATTFNLDYTRVQSLPIVATDPEIIPLYSIIEIKDMGAFVALDTGGAIKGNRIDVLFESKEDALRFGIKEKEVRIIQ